MVRDDVIGGYGSGSSGFMLLAVFLVVLFTLFRRDNGIGGGAETLLPLGAAMLGRHNNDSPADQIAMNRQANFVDPQIAHLLKDQAVDTGVIRHDIDDQTCRLQRSIDQQSCDIEKGIARTIENQTRLAFEGERRFADYALGQEKERAAELRLRLSEKDGEIRHLQTMCAIKESNCEVNNRLTHIEGHFNNRLNWMDDHMLKRPPVWGLGGTPVLAPFGAAREHCFTGA